MLQQMTAHSAQARRAFDRLDQHVSLAFADVVGWRGWKFLGAPSVPQDAKTVLVSSISQAMTMCRAETDAAAFRAIGQLAKSEQLSIHDLLRYRSINDGFGLTISLGAQGTHRSNQCAFDAQNSAAVFVTTAVWERIAEKEEPAAYIGAEYVSRQLVGLLRQLSDSLGLQTQVILGEGTVDEELVCPSDFYREIILGTLTRKPSLEASILRGATLISSVFPLMIWDEVFERTILDEGDIAA